MTTTKTTRARKPTTAKAAKASTTKAKARTKARRPRGQGSTGGRPTLLTPDLQAEIVRLLAAGNYLETVARFVGINRSTIYKWIERGRKEMTRVEAIRSEGVDEEPLPNEAPFVGFVEAVDRADAQAEIYAAGTLVSLMAEKFDPNVRRLAAVNFLDRRHRDRWARTDRHEIEVSGTTRIELSVEEQVERTTTIVAGLLEVGAIDALGAQRAIAESGHVEDDDD